MLFQYQFVSSVLIGKAGDGQAVKTLLISDVPLKQENSIGNTFLNLLSESKDVELYSLFTRSGIPSAEISKSFCITEKMIIKNLIKRTAVGMCVDPCENRAEVQNTRREDALINFMKSKRWTVFFWLQGMVWRLGRWRSPELKKFVEETAPDIVFTTFSNFTFLNNLISYVVTVSDAKLVVYALDNNYSLKTFIISPLHWIKHLLERHTMKKIAHMADLFYVISEVQKKDYEQCFQKTCKILTKGADFTEPPDLKETYNDPLQLVFTGNIALNRWKSLKLIADVLETINRDGVKAQLRIYTATPLTNKMEKALNRGASSFLMGSVPASEIPEIQKNADMLVHVEAMDLANRLRVRQSFSTKIVDYLKVARPILAVGPKDVASMDYLIRNDCAVAADNKKELERKLRAFLEDPSQWNSLVGKAYACGRRYHNRQDIQEMLLRDLKEVCGK